MGLRKTLKRAERRALERMTAFLAARLARRARQEGPQALRAGPARLMTDHYYSPLPNEDDFTAGYFDTLQDMSGVAIDEAALLAFLETALPPHLARFRSWLAAEEARPDGFRLFNGSYMAVDAHLYFSVILENKPKRIIEIGCGNSTHVALAAREALTEDGAGPDPAHLCIEPFPSASIQDLAEAGRIELSTRKVQDIPLERFAALEAGDILFIDSTHVLREAGDVQYEYLQVLPRLAPGVWVHVHDVSLPKPYPKAYFDQGLYWNEQYLLQAYLINNAKTEVRWPGNWLMLRHRDAMSRAFPEIGAMRAQFPSAEPTAFWFSTL